MTSRGVVGGRLDAGARPLPHVIVFVPAFHSAVPVSVNTASPSTVPSARGAGGACLCARWLGVRPARARTGADRGLSRPTQVKVHAPVK